MAIRSETNLKKIKYIVSQISIDQTAFQATINRTEDLHRRTYSIRAFNVRSKDHLVGSANDSKYSITSHSIPTQIFMMIQNIQLLEMK